MQIQVTDSETSTTTTLIHGATPEVGEAAGPIGRLEWGGSFANKMIRKVRAANATPKRRYGHTGKLGFKGVRTFATAAAVEAWIGAHVAALPTGDLLVVTFDGGTVLNLADAALDNYDFELSGVEVVCTYNYQYGALTDATPEPEE